MTSTRSLKRFLVCITSLLVMPCVAQDKDMAEVQLVLVPKVAIEKPVELLAGDGKLIPVDLPTNKLSQAYKLAKPHHWSIGHTAKDKEGKRVFKPMAKAEVLEADKQIVVVTPKGADGGKGFNIIPFANDTAGFTGGTYLIINVSEKHITGNLSNSKFSIQPKHCKLLTPKASEKKNGREYLHSIFKHGKDKNSKAFYTNTWRFNDKARTIVFIHHDPSGEHLNVSTIRSFLF